MNMSSVNLTQEELMHFNRSRQLQILSDARSLELLAALIYLGVLMIIGLIGNSLVVYIFTQKLKRTTQTTLFMVLAGFDLFTCSVAIPFEISDIRYYYNFSSETACKILRFLVSFTTFASNQILLIIAIDRYRKVCHPFKAQITQSLVRKLIVVTLFVSSLGASPAIFLYGIRSAITPIPGLIGSDCSTGDDVKDTLFPIIYEGVLIFFFIFFTLCFIVLYSLIFKSSRRLAFKRKTYIPSERSNSSKVSSPGSTAEHNVNSSNETYARKGGRESRNSVIVMDSPDLSSKRKSLDSTTKKLNSLKSKTSAIAFLVTLCFFLSFIPHLILAIMKNTLKDFDYSLTGAKLIAFNIFLRFYFLNSVCNPFIYSAMNPGFRKECKVIFIFLFCGLCRFGKCVSFNSNQERKIVEDNSSSSGRNHTSST